MINKELRENCVKIIIFKSTEFVKEFQRSQTISCEFSATSTDFSQTEPMVWKIFKQFQLQFHMLVSKQWEHKKSSPNFTCNIK